MNDVRLLFLIPSLSLGGAERSLIKAASHLARDGNKVAVCVLCRGANVISSEIERSIEIFYLDAPSTMRPRLWLRVRRLVKEWRATTVCGWSTYANLVAIFCTRGLDVATVVSERNFLPRMMHQPSVSTLRRLIVTGLIRSFYMKADLVTANSQQSLRALRRYLGRPHGLALLPNLIDVEYLEGRAKSESIDGDEQRGLKLLCVGRLDRQKGFDVLLRALAQLQGIFSWRLTIVGDGPQRDALQRLARSLGFRSGQVQFHGAKANPYPYFRWADIVVVPSRYEGFPNVALEALALGAPLVASRCRSGPAELTCNGRFGVLIRPGYETGFADALLALSRQPGRLAEMAESGRAHAARTYTWEAVRGAYQSLLVR